MKELTNSEIESLVIKSRAKVLKTTRWSWLPILLSIFGGFFIFILVLLLGLFWSWYYSYREEKICIKKLNISSERYKDISNAWKEMGYK
tara:strand:+ start:431 stop:697 length:267 start_codon:yes stop_codon:yes gene_type:complete